MIQTVYFAISTSMPPNDATIYRYYCRSGRTSPIVIQGTIQKFFLAGYVTGIYQRSEREPA